MTNCIIVVENNQPKHYQSLNSLIDDNEEMVRAYLKQLDEFRSRKEIIKKMEAERDSLLARANAIQKDIDGMTRKTA